MSTPRRLLPLLVCALTAAPLGADELPPRALARLGDHRFYHGPGITCAVLSPDGSRVASTATAPVYFPEDGDHQFDPALRAIVLWDAATGDRLREWRLPNSRI